MELEGTAMIDEDGRIVFMNTDDPDKVYDLLSSGMTCFGIRYRNARIIIHADREAGDDGAEFLQEA